MKPGSQNEIHYLKQKYDRRRMYCSCFIKQVIRDYACLRKKFATQFVYLKVHRAKAILSHLVKCIAGEIVTLKDSTNNQEKRVRSRTISAGGSTATDWKIFSKVENSTPDYTEISSIPPLPLYALLAADEDQSPKPGGYTGVFLRMHCTFANNI